ncbi:MAG: hypothetical protein ACI4QM_02015 [Alphaproteobacteria bacterium]
MVKQEIFLSSALGLCLGLCLVHTPYATAAEHIQPVAEMAQGDGDPSETIPAELLTDEKEETSEDAVATITAEGDFLLPTYLLPVEGGNTGTQTAQNEMVEVGTTTTTTTVTTTTTQDLPVVSVEQKENDVSKAFAQNTTEGLPVVTVSQTAQTPRMIGSGYTNRLTSSASKQATPAPRNQVVTAAPVITPAATPAPRVSAPVATTAPTSAVLTASAAPRTEQKPILIPLAALPVTPEPDPVVEPYERKVIPSEYADQMLRALAQNEQPGFIMPREIKVSFYKNATDFSGQTLKWIKAFSINALNDPRLIVQIRISQENPLIQRKRLSVIKNTLIGSGLSAHQIQVVRTARPADSLVLRLTDKPEAAQITIRKSGSGRQVEKRTTKW